ncbi:unnamed protein product [Periconia digitata]|uniref:FAD-binding domain-containing protein n=1 Tax=Periconia digitata TaxID=1303443 RepID=A0A9W4XGK4_9PLEO|nr:unnamed protein product [Periconia digitata]
MGHRVPADTVLIMGAGVAGLVLAQGLRLRSIPFRLFERHPPSHQAQGHRFRISSEAQMALERVLPSQIQRIFAETAPKRNKFQPQYVSHDIHDDGVLVSFADGSHARGQLLVGADGVKSRVRKQLQPTRQLLDLERWIMWGRTPVTESLKENIQDDLLSWSMCIDHEANVQTVVEPILWPEKISQESDTRVPDFSDYVYWVMCTAPLQYADSMPKTMEEKKQFLERAVQHWHPSLQHLLRAASHESSACSLVLSSKPDICLSNGRSVTLVGDAAHAMSPMGGSGADTAIRNAADLAQTIAQDGITTSSIADFEVRMAQRAKEKIEHSFRGGQKFWRGREWYTYNGINL